MLLCRCWIDIVGEKSEEEAPVELAPAKIFSLEGLFLYDATDWNGFITVSLIDLYKDHIKNIMRTQLLELN